MSLGQWFLEWFEQRLHARFAYAGPITRGVVEGAYEAITGRELRLRKPKRRRPRSLRRPDGTRRSYRKNGRVRRLKLTPQPGRRGRDSNPRSA